MARRMFSPGFCKTEASSQAQEIHSARHGAKRREINWDPGGTQPELSAGRVVSWGARL